MAAQFDQIRKRLEREAKDAVADAMHALERGQSVTYAQERLREISKRLEILEEEFRGSCTW